VSDPVTRRAIADDSVPSPEPRRPGPGVTRVNLLKWCAAAGGALTAGGLLAGGLPMPAVSQPSAAQDRRVLEWLVQVEQLQAGFYTEAERRGALSGELRELSKVVGDQERAHVGALERELGGTGSNRPAFDFGDATSDPQRFLAAAMELEALALAAFNGQVPNLTKRRILTAMGIASVEARHVGWVRDLAGRNPAPRPADVPATQDGTRAAIEATGFTA
jgi:Ferritin-like domain